MQRAHCYVTAIACIELCEGAGRPSTGSTGATVSIFLGQDSEAKKLCAELGGYSCIDRPRSQRTIRERLRE